MAGQQFQLVESGGSCRRFDVRAGIVQAEHWLKEKDTAAGAQKDAFEAIIPGRLYLDSCQQIHEHLQTVGLSGHEQAAAAATWPGGAGAAQRAEFHRSHLVSHAPCGLSQPADLLLQLSFGSEPGPMRIEQSPGKVEP